MAMSWPVRVQCGGKACGRTEAWCCNGRAQLTTRCGNRNGSRCCQAPAKRARPARSDTVESQV